MSVRELIEEALRLIGPDVKKLSAAALPPGYDIVLLMGQSNMSGRGGIANAAITDAVHPSIFQYATKTANGQTANTIVAASEPLNMVDTPTGIGPGLQFARWYASRRLARGRKVLLVPVARGGSPLSSTATTGWRRGVAGNLYANALTQARGALAAAGADARFVAALWLQGETDGDNSTTAATYQSDLDALIQGLRDDLAVPALPFIVGTMVPEYLSTGTRTAIDGVHRDTPNRLRYTDVAVGASNANNADGNHYNAAGQRLNGKSFFDAYERLTSGLAPVAVAQTATPEPSTSTTLGVQQSPAQAYSTRRVKSDYTGPAMQVRRSSDSTTQDIGFTSGGALDTSALTTFVGSGDGMVVTWYDQSGNGRHVTQGTAAAQPKIVAAGTVVVQANGTPAVQFDGSDDVLSNTTPVLYATAAVTMLAILKAATPSAVCRWWTESISSSSANQYGLMQPDSGGSNLSTPRPLVNPGISPSDTTYQGTIAAFNGTIHQLSAIDAQAAMSQWVDGAQSPSAAVAYTRANTTAKDRFAVGGVVRSGSLAPLAMVISELVFFPSALSDTNRATAQSNQKAVYATA